MAGAVPGFGVESAEVDAVIVALVGPREVDDDAITWYRHLSSRQSLAAGVVDRLAEMRAVAVAELFGETGDSIAKVAERLGLSKSRADQLIARGRALQAGAA
jgi:hypothetical protein